MSVPSPSPVQTDFDFIVPTRKELMTVEEVAGTLRIDRTSVYNLVIAGELEMHRRPGMEKSHGRVTRRSLVAYLAKSANYEAEHMVETLLSIARTLTPQRRRELATKLAAL
jgi:excisionase family DNA binding protein